MEVDSPQSCFCLCNEIGVDRIKARVLPKETLDLTEPSAEQLCFQQKRGAVYVGEPAWRAEPSTSVYSVNSEMHPLLIDIPSRDSSRLSETGSHFLPHGQPFQGAWNDNSVLWLPVDGSLKMSPIVGPAIPLSGTKDEPWES